MCPKKPSKVCCALKSARLAARLNAKTEPKGVRRNMAKEILAIHDKELKWHTVKDSDPTPNNAVLASRQIYESNATYREAVNKRLREKVGQK